MSNIPVKVQIGAIDKISSTLSKVRGNFPKMDKAVRRSSTMFKVYQMRTEKLRKSLAKTGQSMKSVGSSMSMGLTAPLVGMGAYVIKASADFEKGMNKVKALAKDSQGNLLTESSAGFKKLRDQAKDLGATTKFSATEVADAMGFLGMAGLDANKIFAATPGLLDLAAASGMDLGQTADIASNMMGMFGMKASEMGKIADILAATTSSANVDMNMLAESMKYAGPVAKTAGLSLKDTAAAIGLLGNVGIQGSSAGTGLKNALLGLNAPGSKARKLFKELGVEVKDSNGNLNSFSTVMGSFSSKIAKLPKDKQLGALKDVFGKIGISSAAVLGTKAMTGEMQNYSKSLENIDGTSKRMAKTMNSGASGAMKSLSSAAEGLAIAFGDSGILGVFTSVIQKITGVIRGFSKASPVTFKIVAVVGLLVAALGPMIFIFGSFLAMIPAIITGMGALGISFTIGLWPILAIVAAIAAVIAIGVLLYKNFETIKNFMVSVWDSPLVQLLLFLSGIKLIMVVVQGLAIIFKSVFGYVGDLLMGLIDIISEVVTAFGSLIFGMIDGIQSGLKSIASYLPDSISNAIFGDSLGPAAGADKVQKNIQESKTTEQSSVMMDFKNVPQGTNVKTEGPMSNVDMTLGMMTMEGF